VLECAVVDTRRDLEHGLRPEEAMAALQWLLEAAAPLVERRIGSA